MRNIIFTIIALLVCMATIGQTKLSLLDGTQYNVKEYSFFNDNGSSMEIKLEKKNGKIKTKFIDLNEIWSVGDSILYIPTQEGEFAVEDMRSVVLGKQTAKSEFNPWWAYAAGFVVGAGSVLYIGAYENRPILSLAVPIAYATGISFTRPTKKGIMKRHPEYSDNEYFVYGYQNKGRRKIMMNTIIGTLGGITVGAITSLALKSTGTIYVIRPN
ncbi:MAG: hypothetical protein IK025_07840 [Bacteroidales bacterium]|nr:hypothetical protein [Bacteroidales bacterium]